MTTYYVDKVSGKDNHNGTCPGLAWETVTKVNGELFNPGDSILFKRGCEWNEGLIIPSAGVADSPIIFGTYDRGDKPILSPPPNESDAIRCNHPYVVIENFKCNVPLRDWGMGIFANAPNVTIRFCEALGIAGSTTLVGIKVGKPDCLVQHNGASHVTYGVLLYANNGFSGVVESNIIRELDAGDPSDADGIKITAEETRDFSGLIVRHNDISGFQEDGIDGIYSENMLIEFNRIHDPGNLYTNGPNINGIKIGANNIIQFNLIERIAVNDIGAGVIINGSDTLVRRNIISDVLQWGVLAYVGHNTRIEENILIDMPVCISVGPDATITENDNLMNSTVTDIDIQD